MSFNRQIDSENQPSFYQVAWSFYLALAMAGVCWIGFSQGSLPLGLFLDTTEWWLDILLGSLSGVGLVILWKASLRFSPTMRRLEDVIAEHIRTLDSSQAIVLALISGFAEELFFRGAVQNSFGWVWATLIFVLLHSGPSRIFRYWALFSLVAALIFAGLTLYRDCITAAVIAHSIVNGVNLRRLTSSAIRED